RTIDPVPTRAERRECPKRGLLHQSQSAGSVAASPRPLPPDRNRVPENRPWSPAEPDTRGGIVPPGASAIVRDAPAEPLAALPASSSVTPSRGFSFHLHNHILEI